MIPTVVVFHAVFQIQKLNFGKVKKKKKENIFLIAYVLS